MVFFSVFLTAQNKQEYYLEIKPNFDLGTIQETINNDGTISISTNINDFSNFVNNKQVYVFKKAFPSSITPKLQRVYLITLEDSEITSDFMQRSEVENIVELGTVELVGYYPNDYTELIAENFENTALELIKAPLAWTITKGDPNILVGIADTKVDLNHEDLQGQIVDEILLHGPSISHGTGVASMVAAKTNNDKGIARIGFNTKLVVASCNGYSYSSLWDGLLQVSQYPGVKVVNCSWRSSTYNPYHELVVDEISANGVLIVAAAGNSGTHYNYPASYNKTISVSSVGSRYEIGTYNSPNWWRSWKDCYNGRPDYGEGGHTRNDKVDVTAPGQLVLIAEDDYANYPEGYRLGIGTSQAAPIVSGLAALIFAVNPNLTAQEVKQIIKSTADDIYHIPYNQPYIGELGTGRINAYRAVKTAECLLNPGGGLDLAMQNSNEDSFVEPDTETDILWESNDIWIRNQNDGKLIQVHENPEYSPSNPNYVYVRVTNNSCVTSSGNDNVRLHWAKASTSLHWPGNWNGTLFVQDPVTNQNVLMGDEIGLLNIPVLGPGETKILEFEWHNLPNPDNYVNINPSPWHFCFLARIESLDDPMTPGEEFFIPNIVKKNNNIVWKNTTVVDLLPNLTTAIGGVVGIGNPYDTPHSFNLEFKINDNETGKAIYNEAEVSLEMDTVLYNAWQNGGYSLTHADSTNISKKKIITANNAKLSNIQLGANEIGTLNVNFNFLAKELTNKKKYSFYVIQRDAVTNELIGGETYIINKTPRPVFTANAGGDETIDKSESITINAAQINEAAIYNWYDPDGNLIYTGTNLTVAPDVTKKYKLEIISDIDGYKDYDEVEVTVNPYHMESLVPNPASNQVTINYTAEEANSAYLMVVNTTNSTSDNYIINTSENSINLDISAYTNGTYSVSLVCDGVIQDSKNLLKQ